MSTTNSFPLTVYKASAGSGKTFTLASEYIKLLVRNPQSYKAILAVTFTNKATEEMKMRILTHLYGIWKGLHESQGYADKVFKALGGSMSRDTIASRAGEALHLLLHNYSFFRVETIDSFFQSVLRNLARELNLTANLRVGLNDAQVEEMAVDQLIDSLSTTDVILQWLMRYIMDNIGDDRSWNVIGQIKRFGLTIFKDNYKAHSKELAQVMEQDGFFERYQGELRKLRQQAMTHMQSLGNAFFEELQDSGLDVEDFSYGKGGVAGLFLKLQNGVFDESVLTKRVTDCAGQPERWYKKTHPRRDDIHYIVETSLDRLLRRVIDEQPLQWKLYKSADVTLRHLSELRLLGSIEKKVRELNDEQNRFLLSDTQQLLHELIDGSDTPFIFEKIGTQLEHIMIDEFQDTSTVQWQNFKVLLEETMSYKGSESLIVGDVKQSIYRWRSGDWRLLANITSQFANAGERVHVEPLGINYRSNPRIVDFNSLFFAEAAAVEDVAAYADVKQTASQKSSEGGYVQVTLFPAADYELKTLETLCTQVAALLEQGVPTTEIAILVRANNFIPLIARYFMEHLPEVTIVSDEAFRLDASSAVMAIVEALRLMVHPDNSITRTFLAKTTGVSADDILTKSAESHLYQMPLTEQVERLYVLLHLDRMAKQSAYLCSFFDYVTAFVTDHGSDIDAFLREWDETISSKTIQSPENDGIRLISIHKSKGLEFPYVFIPFCDWRLEQTDTLWCTPGEEPFSRLPLVPVDFSQRGMKGTIYDSDYETEHQQNIVDNLNLLYVAFTRASVRLFVYGKRKSNATSRSALIGQVLPAVVKQLEGSTLSGTEDGDAPLIFSYGNAQEESPSSPESPEAPQSSANPFLQRTTPVTVPIEVLPSKVNFKQSNSSIAFTAKEDDAVADSRQTEYIQVGSVLHSVLSTIRTTDDIPAALHQMENDGVLYGSGALSQKNLTELLRKRLADARVAEWFRPGRWQLFNECTILSTDPTSGRIVERRPDRVMSDGEQTVVVDFKFGRDRQEYHEQVHQYIELLTSMGMPAVRGYLWLVYSNQIIEV